MVTNTGRILIGGCCCQWLGSDPFVSPPITIKGVAKNNMYPNILMGNVGGGVFTIPRKANDFSINGMCMRIGLDNTEPQETDYNLGNTMLNGVDVNTVIKCMSLESVITDYGDVCFVGLFTNTTNYDIDIKEVGLFLTYINVNYPEFSGNYLIARSNVKGGKLTFKAMETNTLSIQLKYNAKI